MLDLIASAVRGIHVTVSGNLANARYKAYIEDIYPGGKRRYIRDPGTAEVFISEIVDETIEPVPEVLVPWSEQVTIPDLTHNQVTIYVNNKAMLKIDVEG